MPYVLLCNDEMSAKYWVCVLRMCWIKTKKTAPANLQMPFNTINSNCVPRNVQSSVYASALRPKISKSFSTSVIPAIPKFSTKTFTTFGDKKAGSVGPR